MIRIKRSNKPVVLQTNEESWTQEYLKEFQVTGKAPKNSSNRYGHEEIRSTLSADAFNKCMYCESKIAHNSYPNVEHILPKAKYPDKTYEWENLGLACHVCNTKKGVKYDEQIPFVNPYDEQPSEHLYAFGELLRPIPGSDRGKMTIIDVDLNRPELIEKRGRLMDVIQSLAEAYARADSPKIKNMFLQELCMQIELDKEYVVFIKALINEMGINCDSEKLVDQRSI